MESIFKLGILMRVTDMVSGPVNRMKMVLDDFARRAEQLQPTFDRFKDFGTWIAAAGVAGAIGLGVAVTQFANLEEAQLGLQTMVMNSVGQIGPEYEKLNSLAERLGTDLPGSTKDMLGMFTALREQGVQTNTILGGMGESAAKFAVLMKIPYAQGATMVAKFTEALGIADNESIQFMDTLQRLKGAAGVNTTDMYESLKYMGSTLKMLRVQGLEAGRDVSAAIGMMATSSIEGSQAGTNLAMALSRFAEINNRLGHGRIKKEIEPLLAMKGIKLNLFDAGGNFVGIRGMMREMEKLRALNPQQQLEVMGKLFGQEAARPLSVFIEKGVAGFDEMLLRMKNQADMQTKINLIMSGSKMQWDTMTGTISNVIAHIGGVVTRTAGLIGILQLVNNLAGKLDAWVLANPTTAGIIAGVTVAVIGAALAIGSLFLVIGIGGTLFVKVAAGVSLANDALLILRTALNGVIGRVGALSAAGMWIWIKTAVAGFRTWALTINAQTIPALLRLTTTAWGFNAALLANPATWIVAGITAAVVALGYVFTWAYQKVEWFKTLVDGFMFTIGFSLGFFAKGFKGLAEMIAYPFEFLFDLLAKVGPAVSQAFAGAFNALPDIIKGILPSSFKEMTASGGALITHFSNAMTGKEPWFRDQTSQLLNNSVRVQLPHSDAKIGPLSSLTLSGTRLMETLGKGVVKGAPGLQKTMATALAGVALTTTMTVDPALAAGSLQIPQPPAVTPVPLAANQAQQNRSTANEGKKVVIQIGKIELPGVSNGADFVKQLQALVEGYDV